MNPYRILLFLLFLPLIGLSQSDRGKIIKPASPILDPNGDGFVSKTNQGFGFDGYYVDEFEIFMFGIPKLGGDVTGDNIGNNCGITDLTPDNKGYSVYAVRDNNNNLIFRFRVGDDNPSVEAWTILLDTDGLFGDNDPNSTEENPGFEIDITLIKNVNKGVLVYNIDGIDSCPTPLLTYPFSTHFQIAIADEVTCGDPDYFYDFFVPFNEIAAQFGISATTGLRYAAVSNVSATCAMAGKISDVSGVDNNDPEYEDCVPCAFQNLVSNQCPTPVLDLCETCPGFSNALVDAPTIDTPVRAGQPGISGTAEPNVFIAVEIYSRIGGTDTSPVWDNTPRELKTTFANSSGIWMVTLSNPLESFDRVVAKAQLDENTVPCGADGDNSASASVTVVQPNERPVADSQNLQVIEDTPLAIVLTGTDPDGDIITYTIVTPPTNGTLSGTPPAITYTPNPNYHGADTFTFQVSDGIYQADPAGTISLTVQPVNDAPVAANQQIEVTEDIAKTILLTGSDVDGDALTFAIATQPSHGTLSGTEPNLVYTPDLNYNGSDSFTFTVQDGSLSSTGTILINVTGVNDAPVANDQSLSVPEDGSLPITLTGSDIDLNTLLYSLVNTPVNGTLSGTGRNWTYTPNLNYNGNDSFTFQVNDGLANSNVATISITVTPVNDAPIAEDQSLTTNEDTPLPITLSATDVENSALTYAVQSVPAQGVLTGTAPNFTYTPNSNYQGADSFTFHASDGTTSSNVATIFITINPVNDAPVVNDQTLTTDEDTALGILLTGNDPDGDALTYLLVSAPAHGAISGVFPAITYTPDLNYSGSDSFTFKANDGTADSNTGTVSITVQAKNDAPIALDQTLDYQLNAPRAITLTAIDLDNDPLSFTILTLPTNGNLTGVAPNITYTPNLGFVGTDQFTFQVNDGTINSNIATVTLSLDNSVNDPPIATDQNVTLAEDTPTSIALGAADPEGAPLTYTIASQPVNGTLSGTGSVVIYSPAANYSGSDSFTFSVNDGVSNSNTATVSLIINPVNDAPTASANSFTVNEDTELAITLVGNDIDLDNLTYTIVTPPAHGTLTGTPPGLTYQPELNFNGLDNFTFRVNDGSLNSNIAGISITVLSINDPPLAGNDQATTNEDQPHVVILTANDTDPDGTVSISSVDLDPSTPAEDKSFVIPGQGTYTVSAQGQVTFTPAPNFFGTSTLVYTVKDNEGALSNPATLTFEVNPINDAPIPQDVVITVNEDESVQVCILVSDAENDPAIISNISLVSGKGTIVPDNTGALCFTFIPTPQFNGQEIALVTICDPNNPDLCNVARVTINVLPINDPPFVLLNGLPQNELTYTTPEDTALPFCFEAVDIDGDITQIGPFDPVGPSGTLTLQPSGIDNKFCFTFEPNPDYNGPATWNLSICDATLCTAISIIIIVTPENDPPTVTDQAVEVVEDTPETITLTASDIDSDTFTFSIIDVPVNGTITGTGPDFIYTPAENYFGKDSLTYRAHDGALFSNIAKVVFTVLPVNDAPVIDGLELVAKEDSVLQICVQVLDVDGDLITYETPVNLSGGGEMVSDPDLNFCFLFTPATNYNGMSRWQLKACDTNGLCGVATASINILPVNDPPVANPDQANVAGDAATLIDVLSNDRVIADPYLEFYDLYQQRDSSDQLQLIRIRTFKGRATIENNQINYTPQFEFQGIDSVQYWIQDSGGLIDSASVRIEVGPAKFRIFQAVSPNGDGLNDYWRINGIEQDPENEVKIFDRYNNLVFETTNYSNERNFWTGQANHGLMNGNLPDGTYFYTIYIDLTEDDEGRRLFNGYIILKRN